MKPWKRRSENPHFPIKHPRNHILSQTHKSNYTHAALTSELSVWTSCECWVWTFRDLFPKLRKAFAAVLPEQQCRGRGHWRTRTWSLLCTLCFLVCWGEALSEKGRQKILGWLFTRDGRCYFCCTLDSLAVCIENKLSAEFPSAWKPLFFGSAY